MKKIIISSLVIACSILIAGCTKENTKNVSEFEPSFSETLMETKTNEVQTKNKTETKSDEAESSDSKSVDIKKLFVGDTAVCDTAEITLTGYEILKTVETAEEFSFLPDKYDIVVLDFDIHILKPNYLNTNSWIAGSFSASADGNNSLGVVSQADDSIKNTGRTKLYSNPFDINTSDTVSASITFGFPSDWKEIHVKYQDDIFVSDYFDFVITR